jgi:hypothetical protein
MNKVLCSVACLAIAAFGAFAEGAEPEAKGEEKPNALSCSIGVSGGDILDKAGAIVKVGAVIDNLLGSSLSLGVDTLDLSIYPESKPSVEAYIEGGTALGDSSLSLGYGAHYSADDLFDGAASSLWALGSLHYSLADTEISHLELDAYCLRENEWGLSLAAILGGGWDFALGPCDTLSCWVDFNFNLYAAPSIGDVEGKVAYEHAFGDKFSLALEIAPTLVAGDAFKLSCEPTLTASISL